MNETPHSDRPPVDARVLVLTEPSDIAAELRSLRLDATAANAFESRVQMRVVRLDGLTYECAEAIRREVLSLGGEAYLSQDRRVEPTAALLAGTPAQYLALSDKLAGRGVDEGQAAAQIQRALAAFGGRVLAPLRCRDRALEVGTRTLIMGVINATPDSFSGDGLVDDLGAMVELGVSMAADGADILDVGGESSRPGAEAVDLQTEMDRVLPLIARLNERLDVPISIDTYKSPVARAALDAGASIINDITALRGDSNMAKLAAEHGVPVVVMHMLGTPRTMQDNPRYDDLMGEIAGYLSGSVEIAERAGVRRDQVVIDPGFGFGKTVQHNLEIVRRLRELKSLGQPVLLGPSRKSTIGKVLDLPAGERLEGTLAVVATAVAHGADILRVHDVRAASRNARMADAIVRGWPDA